MGETPSAWSPAADPKVIEAGPYRVIGVSYVGKNEKGEIPALWRDSFLPRVKEIMALPEAFYLGVSRYPPGVGDGSFEYIAAIQAQDGAPIPPGMTAVEIPRSHYVVFTVRNISEFMQVWEYARTWMAEHPEWGGYCGLEGCDGSQFPCFEYYPPDYQEDRPLYFYLPVRSTL